MKKRSSWRSPEAVPDECLPNSHQCSVFCSTDPDPFVLVMQDVKKFSSFQQMLEVEGLSGVLPGVASVDEGQSQ